MEEFKISHSFGRHGLEDIFNTNINHLHLLGFRYVVLEMNYFMLIMLLQMVRTAGRGRKTDKSDFNPRKHRISLCPIRLASGRYKFR